MRLRCLRAVISCVAITALLSAGICPYGFADESDPPKDSATAVTETAAADADAEASGEDEAVPEGHSNHGEVFNEGPRQAAYLMPGVGQVSFKVTTDKPLAADFVRQGVGQLHGFWYFESERSFRQAAAIDPDCAIAYWGMAMSNRRNEERARDFISEAVQRQDKASRHEQLYISAFERFVTAKSKTSKEKQSRAERYVKDLEELLFEFPDDLEAKAFLCEFLWSSRSDAKSASYLAIDAMIQDVLDAEPLHPIHHYRIHLWDSRKAENALESAARCGLSAPAIAHMWHMPGHIYSRLQRYHDAVYQQEASARVDHAHMMKDLILPDQIHNFAHNNEWCIRNLIHIGRVHDAVALAQNMIELPRHPEYNHIDRSGSYKYGRQRLLDVLQTFQLHDLTIQLSQTPYLEDTGNDSLDLDRDRALATAYAGTGRVAEAETIRSRLQSELEQEQQRQTEAKETAEQEARDAKKNDKEVQKAVQDAENKHKSRINSLQQAVTEIDGRLAFQRGEFEQAAELLGKASGVAVEDQVAALLAAGQTDKAVEKIAGHVRSNKQEVRPLAAQIVTLWQAEKRDEAKAAFQELRQISSTIDLDVPAFATLSPIARELGFDDDWRQDRELPEDLGARPALDSLGPFRWQPVQAPDWSLTGIDNQTVRLESYQGRPLVVIFYLGYGCLHCAEQLQKFEPEVAKFRDAGIEVVAISTDRQELLSRAYEHYEGGFSFPLLADPDLNAFREYRCYDDFEQQPMHGTFVIDADGKIRWQDISYEPFMDPEFLLKETQRLLKVSPPPTAAPAAVAAATE